MTKQTPVWQITEKNNSSGHITFRITEDDEPVSHHRFLELLSGSEPFRQEYTRFLAQCDFPAFFWECKPINKNNLHEEHECTLVKSSALEDALSEPNVFRQHFRSDQPVVSFANLGGDARLIAPCPLDDLSIYAHLGVFVRQGSQHQISAFWQLTGSEMRELLGSQPLWLSTCGLGVYWLHARIDTRPKYYQTEEYKHW